ncbi:hypothetical protein CBR_g20246 [Chara braunii]|uniref:Uncharacterized protein n=1 Tax=Chara braunii TaxID=69332 RepID=A0A388KZY2_CHABU|nr:hypothetical protein CBR_g20246 [Chara braunii]|eukprot:GBG75616.1 hypothetical protein CBR_g20246 [Chara braunii]
MHGVPFSWNDESSPESLVDVYLLAEQYQVCSLCERVVLFVSTLPCEPKLKFLLNAAVERRAEGLSHAAAMVMVNSICSDNEDFKFEGLRKETIVYVLTSVELPPHITETEIADALLCPLPNDLDLSCVQHKNAKTSPPPAAVVIDSSAEEGNQEGGGCLSREDVQEIFENHIDLPFIKTWLVEQKIEPLQILRPEVLAALRRVQAVCLSRGMTPGSLFVMPWRSMVPKVSVAPAKTAENEISAAYGIVDFPGLWSFYPESSFEGGVLTPQGDSVRCPLDSYLTGLAVLKLPLCTGRHRWRVRQLQPCKIFAAGVVSLPTKEFSATPERSATPEPNAYWSLHSDGSTVDMSTRIGSYKTYGGDSLLDGFDKEGGAVVVNLDMHSRSLSFANDLQFDCSNRDRKRSDLHLNGLPRDDALYPAMWMPGPGFARIEWIWSGP